MSRTTPDENPGPEPEADRDPSPESGPIATDPSLTPSGPFEVEESAPDGGTPPGELATATSAEPDIVEVDDEAKPDDPALSEVAEARLDETDAEVEAAEEQLKAEAEPVIGGDDLDEDDEPEPVLVWYVLKVQSGREDTIRDALERRVKIQDLGRFFGQVVVPKEKVTEIRNNKKRTVERKSYPGYLMVHMELNEKTWFVVRETPGVGDFVGAHGTPTPMSQAEIDKILKPEEPGETKAVPKIDLERGERVKVKEGPFENFEGNVEEVVEARGLVKVMLIIFNRPTPVDLEYWQVERI